ncbi:sorting nexin-14-like [Limulus polyphemus]|uniref:Sorting nexin-14-like n=1 Tax=Limulus polyphemus TaxID=6850 RepID=A0ABM1SJ90_LIMPO|nr:sorting nexin-14-like [Limulus polyphemus]
MDSYQMSSFITSGKQNLWKIKLCQRYALYVATKKCKRHQNDLSIYLVKPWTELLVPQEIDEAIEQILTLTLKEYVYSWYTDISSDDSFVQELRVALRFMGASLIRRVRQVDLVNIILGRISRVAAYHVDGCVKGKAVFGNLHVALRSREEEIQYLRCLVERLLPYTLPRKPLQCRSLSTLIREVLCGSVLLPAMDVIANPSSHLRHLLEDLLQSGMWTTPNTFVVHYLHRIAVSFSSGCQHPPVAILQTSVTGVPEALVSQIDVAPLHSSMSSLASRLSLAPAGNHGMTTHHVSRLPASAPRSIVTQNGFHIYLRDSSTWADCHQWHWCLPYAGRMEEYPDTKEPKVEFLEHFITSNIPTNNSVLNVDLETILNNQQLLFPFMQFLKEHAVVNILQFCLSVDDFNQRSMNPDMTTEQLTTLHKEAKALYETYFVHDAVDKVSFDEDIVHEIKAIVDGPVENVIKLRTTSPLFRAYEYAYNLLDQIYCPIFQHSDNYFRLLCGDRCSGSGQRNLTKANKRGTGESSVSKLGNKIKGVFWTNTDEGRVFAEESATDLGEVLLGDSTLDSTVWEDSEVYKFEGDPRLKDLSAWRVSIPRVETRMDIHCKYYHVFIIEVQRIDVNGEDNPDELHWTVERKYHEFYVLEAKLIEFHGEFSSVQLPQKRSFGNKSRQFMESRKSAFENFLKNLLSIPLLKGSQLLFRFLKSPVEFSTGFLPDINLGRMIKTVPMKLMKEKGQHLDPFLQAFIASTESGKPKPSKVEWKDIFETPIPPILKKIRNPIFDNNYSKWVSHTDDEATSEKVDGSVETLKDVYDYIFYVALHVYKLPDWCVQLLRMFDCLVRQSLQGYVEWYLDRKIEQAIKPQRVAELLEILKDVLFFDTSPPRTDEQKAERAKIALQQATEFFTDHFGWLTGEQCLEEGTKLLFTYLQNPILNKHLSYVLLDVVVQEIFPELRPDYTPSPEMWT